MAARLLLRTASLALVTLTLVTENFGNSLFCAAGEVPAAKKDPEPVGPYCGVRCVYAALGALQKDVHFEELVSSEFIGSSRGSSAFELERAATQFGARAVTLNRLTADMLRVSPHPVILHVKPAVRSNVYSHWVLFLGMENGRARILDPPKSVELIPLADVLARWDGTGVVVHDQPGLDPTGRFVWIARGTFAVLVAIGVCAIWLLRRRGLGMKGAHSRRDVLAAVGLFGASAGIALLWHWFSPEGFLCNRSAVASVVANFHSAFLPHLRADELTGLLEEGDTVVVDVRRPKAYRRGHIGGAINVPVASTLAERERALEHVGKSSRIVLYCQSEGCNWANELANVLAANGYDNLSLFPGGWQEWSSAATQKKGRDP